MPSEGGHEGEVFGRSELRLRDVLRADVTVLYRAMTDDPYRKNAVLRRTFQAVRWLEHHGEHRMKVVFVQFGQYACRNFQFRDHATVLSVGCSQYLKGGSVR